MTGMFMRLPCVVHEFAQALFAKQEQDVNGTTSSRRTFTPEIYSNVTWKVVSPELPADLYGYLFGDGESFSFTKHQKITKAEGSDLCFDQTDTSMNSQLVSEFGGDMVFTLYCNGGWINTNYYPNHSAPGQWYMTVDAVHENGSFDASLKAYRYGANIFVDEPMALYPITFIR